MEILFSDYFAAKGAKIVIAGTDSLGIMLAQSDILYDRIQMIHTSYIPFAEFSKLIENDSVDEYIEYGGTLTKVHIKHCRPAKNIKIPLLLEIFYIHWRKAKMQEGMELQ